MVTPKHRSIKPWHFYAMVCMLSVSLGAHAGKVSIGSLVSGAISEQYVQEGDKVKKGQKLITIDPAIYQAKLKMLQAQQQGAKVTRDDAQIELDQALDLYNRTVTAKRALDAAQLSFDQAQASYEKAKAQTHFHQAWSKYYYIKAPIAGTITKIYSPLGSTVFKENSPIIDIETAQN